MGTRHACVRVYCNCMHAVDVMIMITDGKLTFHARACACAPVHVRARGARHGHAHVHARAHAHPWPPVRTARARPLDRGPAADRMIRRIQIRSGDA
jgi:hypothetical protein